MRASVVDYRDAARAYLPRFAWGYLEGGAEDWRSMQRNRDAYAALSFLPRVLIDVSAVDTVVNVAGSSLAFPAIVGPTGLNGLYRHRAEETLARAATAAGLPFVLSTASNSLMEDVRNAAPTGDLWLQLYVQQDRRIAESMMARAQACGMHTLLLTVDTPVTGKRDHYARTGFTLPLKWTPRLLWDVISHPRWLMAVGRHGVPQLANLARSAGVSENIEAQAAAMSRQMDTRLAWSDLAWVRKHWKGRVLVKGVQRVADAELAKQHGADGVVLSNHGGRQLDGALSPLEILAQTVDSVGHKHFDVIIDGGVRRGSDIAKAVSLGASAVLLGRAPLYGLAADGESGPADVLTILRAEFDTCLRLLGCPRAAELDASYLAPLTGAGPFCGPFGSASTPPSTAL
ncbi:alpha-hydroxy-acid oxidizing protein [Pigmentiphaga aceris]|uniref:Alpha-hydroxy-acid oxidizing protein n=1 Tax=Pigmentiphaga aceris TaxID=1940612 RepID=A0A5C0AWP9_9BURK|nr:alpha-hydroxy acid oxidase [Pigmentiphaga aceris]QEI04747.1 alpha-hydroxy-acid oxidizing protein [Pigmentiphaga aceris]